MTTQSWVSFLSDSIWVKELVQALQNIWHEYMCALIHTPHKVLSSVHAACTGWMDFYTLFNCVKTIQMSLLGQINVDAKSCGSVPKPKCVVVNHACVQKGTKTHKLPLPSPLLHVVH